MKNYIISSLVIVIIMLLIFFAFHIFKKDTSQSSYQTQYKTYEEYLETLEIKLLTGFVCKGYMSKNDVLNYQIQGTSFHFLLWSYIRLFDYLQANKFESQLIGQIHDSMLIDTIPDEETEIIKVAKKIMCEDIRQYWKWIIVPLDIEIEATNINGNWAEKEEIKIA